MSRTKEIPFLRDMQTVIEACQTGKLAWDELKNIAYRWCIRDYDHSVEVAKQLNVAPLALKLTALFYIEHPLLVAPSRGWIYNTDRAGIEIMRVELWEIPVEIPVNNSFHSPIAKNLKECMESELSTGKPVPSTG